jgi:hypothetical protein
MPGGASVYHRPCHTPVTNYADVTGLRRPDLLQRTHHGLAWTPIDGLYNLCHVGPDRAVAQSGPVHDQQWATAAGLPDRAPTAGGHKALQSFRHPPPPDN